MEKNVLLELLDDPDVIEKIRNIIAEPQAIPQEQPQPRQPQPSPQSRFPFLGRDEEKEKIKITKLKAEKDNLQAENKKLGETLTVYQREYQNLKIQKEKVEQQLLNERKNATQKITELNTTIERSSTAKLELKRELEHTEAKLQQASRQMTELSQEVRLAQQKAVEAQQKASYYQNKYKNIDDCFEAYVSLGTTVHEDLERVLSAESPEIFFSYGVQWTNIEALWDFISYKLTKYTTDEINVLSSIFDYFFQCYQNVNTNYKRLDVSIGDEFDDDIHTRASNSAVSGNISEILLIGYQGIKNGKIKKSIVRM